ncbi:MAG: DUF2853 family protein [Bacteroidota bacterium]
MATFVEVMEKYDKAFDKMGEKYDKDLLTAVAKGLGPSIYNSDSSKIAASDKKEVERIKTNFLIKKLGLSESDDLDGGIDAVMEKVGRSNPNKQRPVVYYLLVKHFGKEDVYAK